MQDGECEVGYGLHSALKKAVASKAQMFALVVMFSVGSAPHDVELCRSLMLECPS